jgi:ligand-binding sensor domain-containing protein/signal transduction histidine kinase
MQFFRISLLILIFALSVSGQTNNYKFRHYTINDGLVESSVNAILEDSRGFLWFGSTGLSKFDGYKFTNYINHANDSTSLVNNVVQVLFEDSKGKIWIGTRNGISIYNRDKNNFTPFSPCNSSLEFNITSFNEDEEGRIYIGTNGSGLIIYNPATHKCRFINAAADNYSLSSNYITLIAIDRKKRIWVGTDNGLNLFDKKSERFYKFNRTNKNKPDWAKEVITGIAFDKDGSLWIGSNKGVARFSPESERFENILVPLKNKNASLEVSIRSLQFTDNSTLWIGTDKGIILFDTKTKSTQKIQNNIYDFESLAANEVSTIYIDRTGGLWVGTRANGVDRLKFKKTRFTHYKKVPGTRSSLSNNGVFGMTEDKDGNIWIATLDGLNKYYPQTHLFQNFFKSDLPGLTTDKMWSVYSDKRIMNDLLWVGTDAGLLVISLANNKPVNPFKNKALFDSLKTDRILAIRLDNHNNLWLGTSKGLVKINFTTGGIKRFVHSPADPAGISSSYIWRLFIDSKENLWICTSDGLNCLKPNSEKFIAYSYNKKDPGSISDSENHDILEDKDHSYWVATADGLNKFNPVTNKFEKKYFNDTPFAMIFSMQQDKTGKLWLGTKKGLIRFNPDNGDYNLYDVEDGIQSNDFNFPSLTSKTGELYFGGTNGFNVFQPEQIKANTHIPPVYLTGLSIMNKRIRVGESFNGRIITDKALEDIKEITLNYNENIIGLEFAALDFQSPGKNQYMYTMENYETSWSQPGNRRFAFYTLEPGTYIFKVKGSNNDNVWNQTGCAIKIIVLPPWWQTIWFKLIVLFACFAALYAFLHIRTRYLRTQKVKLEDLVIKRTSELSQQQEIVREQAERIQHANFELEQLNSELESRVIERTAELEKAKLKAEKADEVKSEFLAQMSHEIRSPINVVLSFSNLIRSEIEDKIDDDLKEGFKSIANAGKRIIRTVDLLLNMSEIQTQTYEFIPEQWDLIDDIIYSILPEYQLTAKEKKLQLKLENNLQKGKITGDNYTLTQIYANLIDNAIKYTQTGSITINAYNDQGGIVICEIQDTGIGISQEFMDKIFHPFTQEEQGYTRRYEGNGLGLALVKKYCELNGIDLSVKSQKGEGTTFILKFNRTI